MANKQLISIKFRFKSLFIVFKNKQVLSKYYKFFLVTGKLV